MRSRRKFIFGSAVTALVLAVWVCVRPTSAAQDPLASFAGTYVGPYDGGLLYVTADGAGNLSQLTFVTMSSLGPSYRGSGGTYQVLASNPQAIYGASNAPNTDLSFVGILTDRGLGLQLSTATNATTLAKQ
jgi:hypothetical protein